MALKKLRTNKNGLISDYHRLQKVEVDSTGHVEMTVLSYASEYYREKEKQIIENNKRFEELMDFINQEHEKAVEEQDNDKIKEWSDAINEMETQWVDETDEANKTYIEKSVYVFENVDIKATYNYSDAYNMLKTLEEFKDAEDLIEKEEEGE